MGALGWEWGSARSWLGQEVSQGTWEITSKFAKNTQQVRKLRWDSCPPFKEVEFVLLIILPLG